MDTDTDERPDTLVAPPTIRTHASEFIEAQARALSIAGRSEDRAFIAALSRALELTGTANALGGRSQARETELSKVMTRNLIAPQDSVQGLLDQIDWSFRTSNGDLAYSLAFAAVRTPGIEWTGYIGLGAIAVRRKLWGLAHQAYGRCHTDALTRYQFANAIEAFARADDPRGRALVEHAAHLPDGADGAPERQPPAEAFRIAAFAAMFGLCEAFEAIATRSLRGADLDDTQRARWAYLRAAFAEQVRISEMLGTTGFAETFKAATWTPDQQPLPATEGRILVGLFDYRNPTFPSNNIGDYVQTAAVAGQLGRFAYAELAADSAVAALISRRQPEAPAPKVDRPVGIVPVNRDFSLTSVGEEDTIWLPVCGWFAHQPYYFHPTLPFARNVIPIFMSYHVARPEQITDEVATYLKAHAPIGCRDMLTARYLRDRGIDAFFNGCVTLTLGGTFPQHEGTREGCYSGEYSASAKGPDGFETIAHLDIETWGRSFNDNMALATDLLERYRQAEAVRTPLLHCLLPSRAMGTPVEFTNVRLADPRFEGLIDASDNERARIVARFEAKFQAVMARIYAGAGRDEVFETWRAVSAPDMEETDRRIAAAATSASDAAIVESAAADLDLSACARQDFGPSDPPGKGDCVDLVFCFDANFTGHFGPTLLSVTQNTDRPLRVHLICRGIRPSMVEEYAAVFPNVSFILYDVTQISYGDVKLLAHISLSTMDRLVSPELLGGIDRAVYLDVDILVRGDVGELADFALDGALIAARDSIHAEWNSGRMLVYEVARRYDPEKANRFRAFMFDGGQVEFVSYNAGVLVMDLAGLRADQFSTKAVAWAREFELHDQFILNIYTRENRADLPPSWNHFATQELIDDPNLVHFIGTIKPWTDNRRHPFDLEWLACREAYLKKCAEITSG